MTTLTDIQTPPASGLNHIDALLDRGPQWNYLTPGANTISYTFSTSAGNQTVTAEAGFSGPLQSFSSTQQQGARSALDYIGQLTGIRFVETADGNAAHLHFANANLTNSSTTGLCSWSSQIYYNPSNNQVTSYSPHAYVYLDNVEWRGQNASLTPGSYGYQTLLHELGHALGLKHPFQGSVQLPWSDDNTAYTLMAYEDAGGPYSQFQSYDIAALNFLYGGDGLGGALGVGSIGGARYLTGTHRADTLTGTGANDMLRGAGGNDLLDGGAGTDTAVFSGASSLYRFGTDGAGRVSVTGPDGIDWLSSIEFLQFSDANLSQAAVVDTVAPPAPTLIVSANGAGYLTSSNTPLFGGTAEAHATVKVYHGSTLLGSAVADAGGVWSVLGPALSDGSYAVQATATDGAGNVSARTLSSTFKVDTVAPATPSAGLAPLAGGNQAAFTGATEAGASIHLVNEAGGVRTVLARTTAGADGAWSATTGALANGGYAVKVEAFDGAGNLASSASALSFTVNSSLNVSGTGANDRLSGGSAANNAFDGGAGIDTLALGGARAGYTVSKGSAGITVSSAGGGADTLVNIERLQFSDAALALDVDGNGGKAYRLYTAALDRAPDQGGLGFHIHFLDQGMALTDIARGFLQSPEFAARMGANLTDLQFINKMYEHVLHRPGEQAGIGFYQDLLANGYSREQVLTYFSESPENQAQVIGQIQNGFAYVPYAG